MKIITLTSLLQFLIKSKNENEYFKCILILLLSMFSVLDIHAQTEGQPMDSTDLDSAYYQKVYSSTYVAKLRPIYADIYRDMNQIKEVDSLELGQTYESDQIPIYNTSQETVTIGEPDPTCSCIDVKWSSQPIPPGESGWVKISVTTTTPIKQTIKVKIPLIPRLPKSPIGMVPITVVYIAKNPGN